MMSDEQTHQQTTPKLTRKPLISGNWKMNLDHFEAIAITEKLIHLLNSWDYGDYGNNLTPTPADFGNVEVSVHPPFTSIRSVQCVLMDMGFAKTSDMGFAKTSRGTSRGRGSKLKTGVFSAAKSLSTGGRQTLSLGAQNCYSEDAGAFTGEVSPAVLAKLDVEYVILGHSERRTLFGETSETINKKAQAVLRSNMTPIVCVGETMLQRRQGEAKHVVASQVCDSLTGLDSVSVGGLVIAYEPIWAIGTGETATADDAQLMCEYIRSQIATVWGSEAAQSVRVQYGGSVKPSNIAKLMSQPDIDGALVGGASLNPETFARIVRYL